MGDAALRFTVAGSDYSIDIEDMTGREWGILKAKADVTAGELQDALGRGDMHAIYVLAYLAVRRANPDADLDAIMDLPLSEFGVSSSDDGDDDDPPVPAAKAAKPRKKTPAKPGTRS